MKIIGYFSENQGAGYYSSIQEGSYENKVIVIRYEGDINLQNIPEFTYWENNTLICDEYNPLAY